MNAIPNNPSLIIDPDRIKSAILDACKPVWERFNTAGDKQAIIDGETLETALREAVKGVGFPEAPASALHVYKLVQSVFNAEPGGCSKIDDELFSDAMTAALDHLRWQAGYEGTTQGEADTLARISVLLDDLENCTFSENFTLAVLHELWSDVRTVHQQLRDKNRKEQAAA